MKMEIFPYNSPRVPIAMAQSGDRDWPSPWATPRSQPPRCDGASTAATQPGSVRLDRPLDVGPVPEPQIGNKGKEGSWAAAASAMFAVWAQGGGSIHEGGRREGGIPSTHSRSLPPHPQLYPTPRQTPQWRRPPPHAACPCLSALTHPAGCRSH